MGTPDRMCSPNRGHRYEITVELKTPVRLTSEEQSAALRIVVAELERDLQYRELERLGADDSAAMAVTDRFGLARWVRATIARRLADGMDQNTFAYGSRPTPKAPAPPSSSRPEQRPTPRDRGGPDPRSAGVVQHLDQPARRGNGTGLLIVLRAGGLQQALPRSHGRPTAQKCPSITFRHPAPDAVLDALVQGVGQAFGAHGAAGTHGLRPILGGSHDEQFVRVGTLAQPAFAPVGIRYHLGTVPSPIRPAATPGYMRQSRDST